MKNLPLILSLLIIVILGLLFGFIVYNKMQEDSSIVQSSVKSILAENSESNHSLEPVHSNQWYSSIYKEFPTSPMYTFPLAFKISEDGIGVSKPLNDYKKDAVFSTYTEDLVVGFESKVDRPEIISIGDFSINLILKTTARNEMKAFLGHGFPYTIFDFDGDSTVVVNSEKNIKFYQNPNLSTEQNVDESDHLIIQVDNKYYALFFDGKQKIQYSKGAVSISNPNKIFLAILDKPNSFSVFEKHRNDAIEDTRINYSIDESYIETNIDIKSNNESVLFSLLPHQFDILSNQTNTLGQYETLRGPATLVEGSSFSTSLPLFTPSDSFEKTTINEQLIISQIKTDISQVINSAPPDSENYFLGTWLGMVSNLILLADTYNLESEKEQLIKFAFPVFEGSFNYYKYDEGRKSLVSTKPEFGNEELNDHHFHYNYYIRFASVLVDNEKELNQKSRDVLDLMVKDIANYNRAADDFPYLRNYDPYEGHSWADGYADSNDGNNQESSSEAINAWYSIYLWGKATNDKSLKDIGLALFNSEINSTLYYWFDKKGIYKEPYVHKVATIVWGGKVDYATWFSGETNMKYGIQLLPFTPASEYLKNIPNFAEYENHFKSTGGDVNKEWGDLFLMLKSYHSKVDFEDISKNLKNYDRNPKSLMYYIISKNQE